MSRRQFHPRVMAEIVKRQDGICACGCGAPLGTDPRDIQYDHEIPLHLEWRGGHPGQPPGPQEEAPPGQDDPRGQGPREVPPGSPSSGGMGKRRMNQHDRMLARYLEEAE